MKIPNKINEMRRQLMRSLTSRVGLSHAVANRKRMVGVDVKRVLISRPNARLGNLLLITPLIQDVAATFPNCKIDLFVRGELAPILFRNYPNIDRIVRLPAKPFKNLMKYVFSWIGLRKYDYDLVINVDENSSSGRLSSLFSRADYKIYGETPDATETGDSIHIAKAPVYNFRKYVALLGFAGINRPLPLLDLRLTSFEMARGKYALSKLADPNRKTICLFTFATGNKCYPRDWWLAFYESLCSKYPDYNIIEILPAHNDSQIDFKAPSFYSRDIREIGALIANTKLFIGSDSGIMHLASAVQTTTIGLFSVSHLDKYEPYGNGNTSINTNHGTLADWLEIVDRTFANIRERKADDAEATA